MSRKRIVLVGFIMMVVGLSVAVFINNNKKELDNNNSSVKDDIMPLGGQPFYSGNIINNTYPGFNIIKGADFSKKGEAIAKQNSIGLNAAIKYAKDHNMHYIKLVHGSYVIDIPSPSQKGINLEGVNNLTIDLNGSTIYLYPNNNPKYRMIWINNANDITITNGSIVGDRTSHKCSNGKLLDDSGNVYCKYACPNDTDKTHQTGHGILITNSKNITIERLKISEMIGDGINISTSEYAAMNWKPKAEQIVITDNQIYNCRRGGISLVGGKIITIHGNTIHDIKGVPSEYGIVIEPEGNRQVIDVIIEGNTIKTTASECSFSIKCRDGSEKVKNLNVVNNFLDRGINICNTVIGEKVLGNMNLSKTKEVLNNKECSKNKLVERGFCKNHNCNVK